MIVEDLDILETTQLLQKSCQDKLASHTSELAVMPAKREDIFLINVLPIIIIIDLYSSPKVVFIIVQSCYTPCTEAKETL